MNLGFRIFEIRNDGLVRSLFHGTNGSRVLPTDVWVSANIKSVRDGSRQLASSYISGFHLFLSYEIAEMFFHKKFRILTDRHIIPVYYRGTLREKRPNSNIWLADEILIKQEDVNKLLAGIV